MIDRRIHTAREPFATIGEKVNERDRQYFQDHPRERAYLRPYVPGEHSPEALAAVEATPPNQDDWVLVRNLAPGIRTRQPVGQIVGSPVAGRITLIAPDGVLAHDIPVVGWEVA